MEGSLSSAGRADAARAFADSVRGLVHEAVGRDAPAELFAGVTGDLHAAADGFDGPVGDARTAPTCEVMSRGAGI